MFDKKITKTVHEFLKEFIHQGDSVVDATVGNGLDTVFLASQVGNHGKVYGFDIQETAIQMTYEQLCNNKLQDRVILIKDSHAHLNNYVKEPIQCSMFNLGYLPKGDKQIITKPKTTVAALELMFQLVCDGGIVSIVVYDGHDGGETEKEAVTEYLASLHPKEYDVLGMHYINRNNKAPKLFFVKKLA